MSRIFSSPKKPKIPPVELPEPKIETEMIVEEAEESRRRERKRLLSRTGRTSTYLSGIQAAIKKRLGE